MNRKKKKRKIASLLLLKKSANWILNQTFVGNIQSGKKFNQLGVLAVQVLVEELEVGQHQLLYAASRKSSYQIHDGFNVEGVSEKLQVQVFQLRHRANQIGQAFDRFAGQIVSC